MKITKRRSNLFLNNNKIFVEHLNYNEKFLDYEKIELISDNMLTVVCKANLKDKLKDQKYPIEEVVIKKIKKDR